MSISQKKKKRKKRKDKSLVFRHNKELYLEALLSLILIFSLTYLAWIHNLADILSKGLHCIWNNQLVLHGKTIYSCYVKMNHIRRIWLQLAVNWDRGYNTGNHFTNECPVCIHFWHIAPNNIVFVNRSLSTEFFRTHPWIKN